jgi:Arc/MetJ-type ribon-helix-helix transcriptional regulator
MEIILPPELEAYVEGRVRGGLFASSDEFISEAIRRKMEQDTWTEEKLVEAERTELSSLTKEDLESARNLIKRAVRTS